MGKRKIEQILKQQKKRKTQRKDLTTSEDGGASQKENPSLKTWTNKQRVLIFCSRGTSFLGRHLSNDLRTLMPHSRADSKMAKSQGFQQINEICEMRNCNKCIFLEARKKMDLYMWIASTPHGPSAKFLIENIHTLAELKMTGNCLRGSRPILSFDTQFDEKPHYKLLKELFIQVFGTPLLHPKSQPFTDRVISFSIVDNRIWFRNYQIIEEDASLAEIGPRFVLNPIRIFSGSFGGPTLYENPMYMPPNMHRRILKKQLGMKYKNKMEAAMGRESRKEKESYKMDPLNEVFTTIRPEDAVGREKLTFYRKND